MSVPTATKHRDDAALSWSNPTLPVLVRKPTVKELTGLSSRGIDNRVRNGEFPKPVLLDARQTAWVLSEVLAWNAARIAERDAGIVPRHRETIVEGRRRGGQMRAAAMRIDA